MLKKFGVENFKGFQDKITFDIGSPSNYSFNSEIIENGCVTKGIIYGINSCGKSNLGLAILDIITHLTEKQKLLQSYDFYINLSGRKSFAEFEYVFVFDEHDRYFGFPVHLNYNLRWRYPDAEKRLKKYQIYESTDYSDEEDKIKIAKQLLSAPEIKEKWMKMHFCE